MFLTCLIIFRVKNFLLAFILYDCRRMWSSRFSLCVTKKGQNDLFQAYTNEFKIFCNRIICSCWKKYSHDDFFWIKNNVAEEELFISLLVIIKTFINSFGLKMMAVALLKRLIIAADTREKNDNDKRVIKTVIFFVFNSWLINRT